MPPLSPRRRTPGLLVFAPRTCRSSMEASLPFGDPSDEFEMTAAPLRPNKTDISGTFTSCSRQRSCIRIPMRGSKLRLATPRLAESPDAAKHFSAFDLAGAPSSRRRRTRPGSISTLARTTAGRQAEVKRQSE